MEEDIEDIKGLLEKAGFSIAVGYDAVTEKILELAPAGRPIVWRCSGYGVHPDGTKCTGCNDCVK